jgi:hypothetical protein
MRVAVLLLCCAEKTSGSPREEPSWDFKEGRGRVKGPTEVSSNSKRVTSRTQKSPNELSRCCRSLIRTPKSRAPVYGRRRRRRRYAPSELVVVEPIPSSPLPLVYSQDYANASARVRVRESREQETLPPPARDFSPKSGFRAEPRGAPTTMMMMLTLSWVVPGSIMRSGVAWCDG